MLLPEDLIEEIARIYGYENIPNSLPAFSTEEHLHLDKSEFYWEDRIKDALNIGDSLKYIRIRWSQKPCTKDPR